MLNRREFLGTGAAWTVSLAEAGRLCAPKKRFSRSYAPHLGMFCRHAGHDAIDQIKFLSDEGFCALEDGGLRAKPPGLQTRMASELARRGMTMGLFVGLADFGSPTFASGCPDLRRSVLGRLRSAIETARRVGGRFLAVVPGKSVPGLTPAVEFRNAVMTLRCCADLCEARELTLLLDPIDHGPGASRLFLRSANQAAELCRAVASPSCRVLFDVHHQSVTGENVHRLLSRMRDVLGYVQLGDAPHRKEPGTGHINFRQVFAALDAIGYDGLLGMEHGNSRPGREGERAVLDAYRALDRAT